jgi:Tol biopolymer transport system component
MSLLTELRRRNVFRVGIAYGVIAWFIIQAADIMLANFGAPVWVFKTVAGLLALGFPLALFLSWAYDLTPAGIEKTAPADSPEAAAPRAPTGIRYLPTIALVVLALAAAWLTFLVTDSPRPAASDTTRLAGGGAAPGSGQPAAQPTLRLGIPVPDGLEITGSIAITRDGTQIAFAAISEDGEQHLYLRRLDSFEPIRVEGSREGHTPFFSPDGSSIGFFARNAIWRAATDGGPPTRLMAAPWMFGADWMDDDTIIYNTGIDSPIRRMTSGGVPLEPITSVSDTDSYAHAWPQHIPGTDRVLFSAWGGVVQEGGPYVLALSTGVARPLMDQSEIGPGRWSASGHIIFEQWDDGLSAAPFEAISDQPLSAGAARPLLGHVHHLDTDSRSVFALSDNGVMAYVPAVSNARRLVRIEPDGSTQSILDQSAASYSRLGGNIAISRDGRQALTGGRGDIALVDLERGIPRRLTFHEYGDQFPAWSHDETHAYFKSNREERWKIWTVPTDRSAPPEVLIEQEHNVGEFSVGPNGEIAFVVRHPETNNDIWIRDPDGEQRPLLHTPYDESFPHLSPDGRFVAYTSNVSGIVEVYILPASGRGVPVQVSTGGGSAPKWLRDGSGLMFRKGRTILRVAVDDGRPVGDAARVFAAPNLTGNAAYELDPDGQSLLAVQVDADAIPREIRVITNFFDEIRRVAGEGSRP